MSILVVASRLILSVRRLVRESATRAQEATLLEEALPAGLESRSSVSEEAGTGCARLLEVEGTDSGCNSLT